MIVISPEGRTICSAFGTSERKKKDRRPRTYDHPNAVVKKKKTDRAGGLTTTAGRTNSTVQSKLICIYSEAQKK